MHLTLHLGRNARTSLVDPVTDLAEACIKSYRESVLTGYLESVVFRRIMRCTDALNP